LRKLVVLLKNPFKLMERYYKYIIYAFIKSMLPGLNIKIFGV